MVNYVDFLTTYKEMQGNNTRYLTVTFNIPARTGYTPRAVFYQNNNQTPDVVAYVPMQVLADNSTTADISLTLTDTSRTFNFTTTYTAKILYIKS